MSNKAERELKKLNQPEDNLNNVLPELQEEATKTIQTVKDIQIAGGGGIPPHSHLRFVSFCSFRPKIFAIKAIGNNPHDFLTV